MLSPISSAPPRQNNFWGYDNYWENAAYIGVIPILLALYAIWNRLRRKVTQGPIGFLAMTPSVADPCLRLVHADLNLFLYRTIPGFALFQGPARWLIITLVALCALAGFGMQQVLDRGVSRKAATRLILLGLALYLDGLAASFVLKGRVETFGPATGGLRRVACSDGLAIPIGSAEAEVDGGAGRSRRARSDHGAVRAQSHAARRDLPHTQSNCRSVTGRRIDRA